MMLPLKRSISGYSRVSKSNFLGVGDSRKFEQLESPSTVFELSELIILDRIFFVGFE